MPTSGPGSDRFAGRRAISLGGAGGFTLIEIIVVMVIIVIMAGMVSVNMRPSDKRLLQDEVERVALLIEQARDEAMTSGKHLGWSINGQRVVFWLVENDGWAPGVDSGDDFYRDRLLDSDVRLVRLKVGEKEAPPKTRIVFSPSGDVVPFELTFALNAAVATVSANAVGNVSVATTVMGAKS